MKNLMLTALSLLLFSAAAIAQNVPSYIPANGLVGWWPFNGNANDESGNGNNGTVNGATLTSDRFGNVGKAYSFDGVSNKITVAHSNSLNVTSSMTFSIWFKQSTMGNTINYIVQKGTGGGCLTTGYYIGVDYGFGSISNGAKALGYGQSASSCGTIGSDDTLNNSWHHMLIIYEPNGNNKMYLDGNLANQNYNNCNNCTIQNAVSSLILGGYFSALGANDRNWNGQLDDIGIWNRALTPQEVSDLYNGGICYQNITVTDTLLINMGITGFNPITYSNTIRVYPNPANDHITIDYGNFASLSGYQLRITNSLGLQMFQSNINQQSDYLDLSSWTGNGIYFVNIIDPSGNTVDIKKIVLQ